MNPGKQLKLLLLKGGYSCKGRKNPQELIRKHGKKIGDTTIFTFKISVPYEEWAKGFSACY